MGARQRQDRERVATASVQGGLHVSAGLHSAATGIRSKTRWYQALYDAIGPLYPIVRRLFPKYVTTTTNIGRAMIHVAVRGWSRQILSPGDINQLSS